MRQSFAGAVVLEVNLRCRHQRSRCGQFRKAPLKALGLYIARHAVDAKQGLAWHRPQLARLDLMCSSKSSAILGFDATGCIELRTRENMGTREDTTRGVEPTFRSRRPHLLRRTRHLRRAKTTMTMITMTTTVPMPIYMGNSSHCAVKARPELPRARRRKPPRAAAPAHRPRPVRPRWRRPVRPLAGMAPRPADGTKREHRGGMRHSAIEVAMTIYARVSPAASG